MHRDSSAGLPSYQEDAPFDAGTLVLFRKRISVGMPWDPVVRPKAGRPSATAKADKKQECQDNADRIEVERSFSLNKRCYGMNCITTKLEETQLTSIALSVFVTNLFRIQRRILCAFLHLIRFWCNWSRCKSWRLQISA